ncbi:MAG: DUF4817 domain-containing protein [Chloroflexi bacterium]|nr:DUF4817 domain-containing protein [Chloroflexota bacterium]
MKVSIIKNNERCLSDLDTVSLLIADKEFDPSNIIYDQQEKIFIIKTVYEDTENYKKAIDLLIFKSIIIPLRTAFLRFKNVNNFRFMKPTDSVVDWMVGIECLSDRIIKVITSVTDEIVINVEKIEIEYEVSNEYAGKRKRNLYFLLLESNTTNK